MLLGDEPGLVEVRDAPRVDILFLVSPHERLQAGSGPPLMHHHTVRPDEPVPSLGEGEARQIGGNGSER